MTTNEIRFDDGAAYERYMGVWSQLAGKAFLAWLAPPSTQQWIDIGCGNGAFTEMLVESCSPSTIDGIDPSEAQLAYARTRPLLSAAQFQQGDAMSLPYADNCFDIAVMPLVIFFVPDPAKGVAEMVRVVRAGGIVTAYAWDLLGGGFPYDVLRTELISRGIHVPSPPSPNAGNRQVLHDLWLQTGLQDVETYEVVVERMFRDFDDYWSTVLVAPSLGAQLAAMPVDELVGFKETVRSRLGVCADGRICCSGRANAVKGRRVG
ncbi:class I SAM-dependent methyltransferase [Moraxellaceae bacterium AER2_44_116]|nr:class I SAM-dependent methyltransferase [Moraxellaceae bacterium]TQC97030.1 class I SAM-dependent methyltransferase [Moraxellaceae bacterium AER2_44_116]